MTTEPTGAVSGPTTTTIELATGPVAIRTAGDGPELLLLHHDIGPSGWGAFEEALARQFHVVAPDMPGFGASPRCEWARHPRDLAAIMLAVARALGMRETTLVGLGFGGWVAAEMAVMAGPEFRSMVLAAPAGLRPAEGFIRDQIMEEHVGYLRSGFSTEAAFDATFPGAAADKDLRARLESMRETIARITWKPYMYSYELPEALRNVTTPATVVWGNEDRIVPAGCAELFAASLRNCSVRLLPTSAHFLDAEAPAALAEIVIEAAATAAGPR